MTVGKDVSALFPDVANCMQVIILEIGSVRKYDWGIRFPISMYDTKNISDYSFLDGQLRVEKIGVSLSDELCKEPA